MRKHIKRNKLNIFLLISCLLLYLITIKYQLIDNTVIMESNFVSVNSIFAGFLFTSLGIIVGILDKEIIVFLDKHGYLDSYINGIVIGLIMHVTSAVVELLANNVQLVNTVTNDFFIKQTIFLLLLTGIIFFIKSFFNIMKLISIIRKQNK